MLRHPRLGLAAALVLASWAAQAEVKSQAADSLLIEHRYTLAASPTAAWAVLVHPERYWPADHTWSGDASNLSLVPEAGGCYCERWAGGSAEHGRVVMAVPGKLLRIRGALGPFQEMAVTGVLTVRLEPAPRGTEAIVTYRLSGDASHRLDAMAAVVDPVVRQQFAGFAALATQPAD
jgi:uncharacterized protein YndB with AHSA1/START domain